MIGRFRKRYVASLTSCWPQTTTFIPASTDVVRIVGGLPSSEPGSAGGLALG